MTKSGRTAQEYVVPFRVRIGVSGHRRIAEPGKVAVAIARFMKDDVVSLFDGDVGDAIRKQPGLLAFSVLTPLAEGADRLVAHEVLKLPGSRIEVILPLPPDEYLKDFATEASRDEFWALHRQARNAGVVPFAERWAEISKRDPIGARNRAYEAAGRHVVDNCDILVALWDGKPARGRGGTAEIVQYARDRRRPLVVIDPETGAQTIERGHGLPAQSLRAVEEFNESSRRAVGVEEYEGNVFKEIFGTEEGQKIPIEATTMIRNALIPWYARASLVAKANQAIYRSAGLKVYLLSPLAVAFAAAGTVFHHVARWAFTLEAVCLASILYIIIFADRHRAHRRWTEHRVLSEYLRTGIYLAATGTEIPRWRIPPYLGVSRQTGDWILRVLTEVWDGLPPLRGCRGDLCRAHADWVRTQWVKDQAEYHRKKADKCEKKGRQLEHLGWAVFISAVAVACVHAVFSWIGAEAVPPSIEVALTFAALSLPGVGAAVGGYRLHEEYSRLRARSRHMAEALAQLEDSFAKLDDPEEFNLLMRKTGMLMLSEVQEWLGLMQLVELSPEPKSPSALTV